MMSMGPSFPPHPPGMQPHPGGPGHPMGAPMAHNPSQPGQPGSMPHQLVPHMAVSGPGGQMNPGMMGGLPPGAGGPNAHAMSHLNPAGAQMFHNPNMNPMAFTNSPQQMHQYRQQQQLRQAQLVQQQQMQQMMQQGVYGNMGGVPVGGMGGMPMNLQAQQMMMRSRMPMPHAANPQQQAMIAQQVALQQQQQQVNNQMAQQGGHPNHPHMNPQQLQNLQHQQAHVLAQNQQLQVAQAQAHAHQQQAQAAHAAQAQAQAHAQAQNQGHPQGGPQQPPNQQQQQQQPQPPQAGQIPPQTPQQSQGGPNGPVGNPQMAGQGPIQGGPGPGQPHAPPQPGQQPQPGPPQTSQAQAQQAQAQIQMAAVANTNAMNNMIRMQHMQQQLRSQCILKLVSFAERLSGYSGPKSKDDRSYWENFTQTFFSEAGVFRFCPSPNAHDELERTFDITAPALPSFFHAQFHSGMKNMQFITGQTIDQVVQEKYIIEAPKASFVYWYDNGSHLVATGPFKAHFNSQSKLELFEFITTSLEEYISRNMAIEAAKPSHNWNKEWHKVNAPSDSKQSPEMSKKGKAKPMKSPPNPPPEIDLPQSAVLEGPGVTFAVKQFLEMVVVMGQMNPLFHYIHQHPTMNPYAALDHLVSTAGPNMNGGMPNGMNGVNLNPNMNPNMAMNPNMPNGQPPMQQQGGPRTPSFNQFQLGQSPAAANQMLPGSPHMGGSPAQGGQMQAPSMQLQVSQQGTSSSGPSANTSPSQNSNKRRRPSGVKTEDDGGPVSAPTPNGNLQVNGVQGNKTKPPTPRISNNKRVKVNPS